MINNKKEIFIPVPHPENDGAFLFAINGCIYTIKLDRCNRYKDDILLSNAGDNFEIAILKEGQLNSPIPKNYCISKTIAHTLIMLLMSKSEESVFYYVCDNLDGDGKKRSRLFGIWYIEIKRKIPNLEKHNFIVPGFNGEEFYISLLINSNHPIKSDFIEQFGNSLEGYNKNEM